MISFTFNVFIYLFFFLLAFCLSLMFYYKQETIYSALLLIVVFVLVAFILILFNVKFLAFTFVIVYVGAVALLFLFVVFMLGPIYSQGHASVQNSDVFLFFLIKFLILFSVPVTEFFFKYKPLELSSFVPTLGLTTTSNDIFIFSNLLYSEHLFLFLVVSMVLLVSMVGSIALCLNSMSEN